MRVSDFRLRPSQTAECRHDHHTVRWQVAYHGVAEHDVKVTEDDDAGDKGASPPSKSVEVAAVADRRVYYAEKGTTWEITNVSEDAHYRQITFEFLSDTPRHSPDDVRSMFHGTVHTAAYNHKIGTERGGSVEGDEADWHVFEINWEPTVIQFAIDGMIYFEFPQGVGTDQWPFDQNFHIIMNVAVGGFWGGSQGIDEAAFYGNGQVMEVDWVRAHGC